MGCGLQNEFKILNIAELWLQRNFKPTRLLAQVPTWITAKLIVESVNITFYKIQDSIDYIQSNIYNCAK